MASRISLSTSFSGRWSLISWCVRKPRVLPILMSVFSSWRRLATSSSVSVASSRPNSRISARSLARDTFMRSGLAFVFLGGLDDLGFDLALEFGFDVVEVLVGRRPASWRRRPCLALALWPRLRGRLGSGLRAARLGRVRGWLGRHFVLAALAASRASALAALGLPCAGLAAGGVLAGLGGFGGLGLALGRGLGGGLLGVHADPHRVATGGRPNLQWATLGIDPNMRKPARQRSRRVRERSQAGKFA